MASLPVRAHHRPSHRRRRGSQQGQVLAIFALTLSVLFGFAGLALDTAHGHGVQLQEQYIADATSISVAQLWKAEAGTTATGPPANAATDPAMLTAQTLATNNKIITNATPCVITSVSSGGTVDDDVFYGDGTTSPPPPPAGCATTPPAFKSKVEVSIPPTLPSAQWPTSCNSPFWTCVQVTTTQVVPNYLLGLVGFPSNTVVATSISTANIPPKLIEEPPVPPPYAEMSFEKATNFKTVNGYPTRGMYGGNCSNCTSHWNTGVEAQIFGYDWAIACTGTAATCDHGVATATAPAIVGTGGRTEYCDSFQANTCQTVTSLGSYGLATQSAVYCGTTTGGGTPCTTTLAGAAGAMQEPPAPTYPASGSALDGSSWVPPTVSFTGVPDCGALILNGDTVNDSYIHQGTTQNPACKATTAEPYIIQPGRYSSIVINHGRYQFGSGNYDLYGTGAPVNTATSGWANGIDHSNETAADWDLCTAGTITSCPTLTSSLWIGHGSAGAASLSKGGTGAGLSVGAYSAGTYPSCTSSTDYQAAGGGDATHVMGRGVYFQFESNSDNAADGFVSTHEVSDIALGAPPLGTSQALSGVPMLFAVESDFAAVHLDGPGYASPGTTDNANGFFGLIWTIHKGNTGSGSSHPLGGVEIDPGLAATKTAWTTGNTAHGYRPALYGQVIADSVAYFGSPGNAVDFSKGWGTVLPVAVPNAQRRIDPFLLQQLTVSPSPYAGYEIVSVVYSGFTAMDGFSSYITVKGQPVYPSRPIWNGVAVQPPPTNNPGDMYPADPTATGWTSTSTDSDGFTLYTSGATTGKNFSIGGDFTWGHQGAINPTSALPFGELAGISYQFPTIPDPTITVSWSLIDGTTSQGGLCGNSTAGTLTFSNVGSAGSGDGSDEGPPPQGVY